MKVQCPKCFIGMNVDENKYQAESIIIACTKCQQKIKVKLPQKIVAQPDTTVPVAPIIPKKSSNSVNIILATFGVISIVALIFFFMNKNKEVETTKTNNLEENSVNKQIDNYIKFSEFCIKDVKTNYHWYIAPDRFFDYQDATNFANNITEKNLKWRIPTFDEIKSLYNPNYSAGKGFFIGNKYYPAKIHNVFNPIGSGSWFWVSDRNGSKKYTINLNQGIKIDFDDQKSTYPVHLLLISK